MDKVAVSVIVVTYNKAEYIYGLCTSLLNSTGVSLEVICVDNGSRDATVDIIRQSLKEARIFTLGKNLGFSRAVNFAAKRASGKYLFSLNQDMEIDSQAIVNLLKAAEKSSELGLWGPKIKFAHSPEIINSFGIAINRIGYAWDDGLGEIDGERFGEAREVLAVCGGALFIRRDLFLKLGGFDEKFFMYGEDVDLGLRVLGAGYKAVVIPEALVFHYKNIFSNDTRHFEFLDQKNRWRIVLKHFPPGLLAGAIKAGIRFDLISLAGFLVRVDLSSFFFRLNAIIYTIFSLPALIRKREVSPTLSEKMPALIKEGVGRPDVEVNHLIEKREWTPAGIRLRKGILREEFKKKVSVSLSRVLLLRGPEPGLVNEVYEVLKELYPELEVVMLVGDKRKMEGFRGTILELPFGNKSFFRDFKKLFKRFDAIFILRKDAIFKKLLALGSCPKIIFTVDSSERLERVSFVKALKEINPLKLFFSRNYILRKALLRIIFYLGEVMFFITGFRKKRINKILLIQLGQLGDLVLETAAVEAIRKKFEKATIISLVGPWGEEWVKRDPLIDKVIGYEAGWLRPRSFRSEKSGNGLFSTLTALWKERINLAVDFRGEANDILLAYLSGARLRLGYSLRSQKAFFPLEEVKFLLNLPCEYPWEKRHDFHQVEHNLRLLKKVGIEGEYRPRAFFNTEEKEWARDFLEEAKRPGPVVIIHPGASRREKIWAPQKFSALIEKLQREYKARVVIVGEKAELDIGQKIISVLKEKPVLAMGMTTLGKLTALISEADLFIGNESGPMHIAASLSIPTIAIMSGVPSLYGPYKTKHRVVQKKLPCWHPWIEHCYCPGNSYQCLREIEVEDVSAICSILLSHPFEEYQPRYEGGPVTHPGGQARRDKSAVPQGISQRRDGIIDKTYSQA